MSSYDDKKVKDSGLTEREEETLAGWAQERISDLREKVNHLKKENNGLKAQDGTKPEKSAVSYGDVENDPSYLPDGSFDAVRYTLGEGHIDVRVKNFGGAYLELTGSDDLGFSPQATNVIQIRIGD